MMPMINQLARVSFCGRLWVDRVKFGKLARQRFSISRWGFETLLYIPDPYDDSILLEKSFKRGCRTLLTQSGDSIQAVYELVQDLHLTEEIILEGHFIGHRLRVLDPKSTLKCLNDDDGSQLDKWTEELEYIANVIEPWKLSMITVPSSLITVDPCSERVHKFIKNVNRIHGKDVIIGLDFSTPTLYATSGENSDDFLGLIQYLHSRGKVMSGLSAASFPVEGITVACNNNTYLHAQRIISLCRALGITSLATDVLRVHNRRPGLITKPKYMYANIETSEKLQENMLKQIAAVRGEQLPPSALSNSDSGRQATPLESLQRALNACIELEKQYLTKFPDHPVSPPHICWGHNLMHTFPTSADFATSGMPSDPETRERLKSTILFLEEWEFLLKRKFDTKFKEGMKQLRLDSPAADEWCLLYRPLASILFRAYHEVLEERKQILCDEVLAALPNCKYVEDLPQSLGRLAAAFEPDFVCLSGTQVYSEVWADEDLRLKQLTSIEARNVWKKIHDIAKSFGEF